MKSMNNNKESKSVKAPRVLSHGVLVIVAKYSLPAGRQGAPLTGLNI